MDAFPSRCSPRSLGQVGACRCLGGGLGAFAVIRTWKAPTRRTARLERGEGDRRVPPAPRLVSERLLRRLPAASASMRSHPDPRHRSLTAQHRRGCRNCRRATSTPRARAGDPIQAPECDLSAAERGTCTRCIPFPPTYLPAAAARKCRFRVRKPGASTSWFTTFSGPTVEYSEGAARAGGGRDPRSATPSSTAPAIAVSAHATGTARSYSGAGERTRGPKSAPSGLAQRGVREVPSAVT